MIKRNALIVLGITLVLYSCGKMQESATDEPSETSIPVVLDTLTLKPFQITYHSIGRIVSEKQVNLMFEAAGKVESVFVHLGDYVEKDQPLAKVKADVYRTAYKQAKSMLEKAKRDLASSESLFKSNVISSDQLEMTRIGLDNARAAYSQANNALENTTLRAPFAGWIVSRNLNIGDIVAPSAAMAPPFVLADMEQLKVVIPVPEARIGMIRKGMLAELRFKSFPDRIIGGEVIRMGLAPKDLSNNYDVEIRLTGDLHDLKLGLVADVRIILEHYDATLVLPMNLIHDDGYARFVYTADGDRAQRRDIEILALSGSDILVKGDLKPGDMLITRGHNDVKEGTLLDIVSRAGN